MKKSVKLSVILVLVLALAGAVFYYLRGVMGNKDNEAVPRSEVAAEKPTINFITFAERLGGMEGEKKYLVVFQNSMELRPGGGFIGSFAIVGLNKGSITEKNIHDSGIFDGLIKDGPEAPFLIKKFLRAEKWGIRDSNWSLDFPTNSRKALELYELSGNKEHIDGVIGVTTNILPFLLKKTGPVTVPGIEGEFNSGNCLEKLEYEVEMGYAEKDIAKSERKQALKNLVDVILLKFSGLGKLEQLALAGEMKGLLVSKDIQLYFADEEMQRYALANNWSGDIVPSPDADYLAVVDANLGARKTDRCMERSYEYTVDFTKNKPQAKLAITYKNTCTAKDFMTDHYHSFVRVFVPDRFVLERTEGFDTGRIDELMKDRTDAVVEKEKDKAVFGNLAFVELAKSRTYGMYYNLNDDIKPETYRLYVQKQAGMKSPRLKVSIIDTKGSKVLYEGMLEKDILIENK